MRHYFQDLFRWIDQIVDWRDENRIRYRVRDLIGTGLMMFMLKLASRRQLNEERGRGSFDANASGFFHGRGIAHGDSVNYFLSRLEVEQLHQVRVNMVRQLMRQKVVDKFRIQGYVIMVVDGTGTISFRQRHCDSCLTRKLANGETLYYHPVLEAKLVCENGLVISLGSEFERNDDGQDKQDCELKAFYRLAEKVKQDFPQLRICLVADGLYAGEPTFRLCEELGWKYLIVLTDDDLPTIWEWVSMLRPLMEDNRRTLNWQRPNGQKIQERCWWTTQIDYHGHTVHVLEYEETIQENDPHRWAWVTNLDLNWHHCLEWAHGGRLRWKIENEGFNTQKNGGYGLEHIWSHNFLAQQNFYLLLQIAHLLNQLAEKGSLLRQALQGRALSLKATVRDLLSEIKKEVLPWADWQADPCRGFQIRLDSS